MFSCAVLCYTFHMRRLLIVLSVVAAVTAGLPAAGFAFPKSDQDCSACHTLSVDQAAKTLQPVIPDVKILEVTPGPIKGLWEVGVVSRGQKGIIYIDYSTKKVISGTILDVTTKTNFTQESFSRINKVDVTQIPLNNALVMGDSKAPNRVIVFDDPD